MEFDGPKIVALPRIYDPRGCLSVVQHPSQIPFEPARVYWIYDAPGGALRHGHAFYTQQEMIVALSGSIDVRVVGSDGEATFTLSRADKGLYVPPMTWRELDNFSTNAVVLVISSTLYDEDDYIRDFDQFNQLLNEI